MLLSNFALLFAIGLSSAAPVTNTTKTLPAQLGPYPVSITSHELVTDRWDALAPTTMKRRLMVSVFKPLTNLKSCPSTAYLPYMPPATLAVWDNYLANETGLPGQDSPLLVFSPGSGGPRFIYDSYNQALASYGYTVIAVDHTYDSLIVEFPDGSSALRNTLWDGISLSTVAGYDASETPFIAVRAADMSSVLDAVQGGHIPGLEGFASHKQQPFKAIAYGQSLGGNTAIAAAEQDGRFVAGMNWDANLFDPQVRNTSIAFPVAMLASQQRWDSGHLNETWPQFFTQLHGWNVEFGINNTVHLSVTDVPLIIDTVGLARTAAVNKTWGTISGKRVQNVVVSHSLSFFDYVLKGKKPTLLQGPSPQYPDVFFIREQE